MPESREYVVTQVRKVTVTTAAGTTGAARLAQAAFDGEVPRPGDTGVRVEGVLGYTHGPAPRVMSVHVDATR